MTRAVGEMSSDMKSQIEAAIASEPDVQAARSVKPGIVAGSVKKPARADIEIDEKRKANEDAFLKVADARIAESEAELDKAREAWGNPKTPKRGALLDEPDEEVKPKVERGEDGKFRKVEDDDAPAETDDDDDDDAPEVVEEEQSPKPKKLTHEKALKILRLEKFTDAALAKMNPEDAIDLATSRASIRSNTDRMASELASLKKAAADASTEPKNATASPATGTSTFDAKKATTRFRETYGEKEAETVEEPLGQLATHLEQRIAAEKAAFDPVIPTIAELQRELTRSRLERVSPELADDAVWDRVRRKAEKMYPGVKIGPDLVSSLHDASQVIVAKLRAGKVTESERAERQAGQPATGSRRAPPQPLSKHDAFGALAEAIEDGDTERVEQIRRSMR